MIGCVITVRNKTQKNHKINHDTVAKTVCKDSVNLFPLFCAFFFYHLALSDLSQIPNMTAGAFTLSSQESAT